MKKSQLRQIIREEIRRALIAEYNDPNIIKRGFDKMVHKPGTTWKVGVKGFTTGGYDKNGEHKFGTQKWGAKNKKGEIQYFYDQQTATDYSQLTG